MFEQSVLLGTARTRRAWTVPLCFAGQLVAVGFAALMPMVFFEGLPLARLAAPVLTAPTAYHPPVQQLPHVQLVASGTEPINHALVAPLNPPHGIHQELDQIAPPPQFASTCPTGFCVVGAPDSIGPLAQNQRAVPPAQFEPTPEIVRPPVRPTPTPAPVRVRVNEGVQEAMLFRRVMPVYPRLAVTARVQGEVRMAAIIGSDGRIRDLQVLSGHPLLIPAAVDAVRQWVYRPTLLSGTPVEVMTEITVHFILN